MSFEVEKIVSLIKDKNTHNQFGDWYPVSTPEIKDVDTDWYMNFDVSKEELGLNGTYESKFVINGVEVYRELEVITEATSPYTSLLFNYNGRGYEISFPLGTEKCEEVINHMLETMSFRVGT